ncbi:threonine/serine exporter family protein [Gordonia sp. VNQ95]|uniref:threonine/serine exporter family protein n=1 Tax=Gordonia sp. VNQ95 TaxID=3156619 RepID=UPI0032B5DBA6
MASDETLDADTSHRRVGLVLSLALGLIESGYPTSDALVLAHRCARSIGLAGTVIIDQGRALVVEFPFRDGQSVVRVGEMASLGGIDCRRMKRIGDLAEQVIAGRLPADAMAQRLADIRRQPGPRPWVITAGMAVLAFAIALQVGVNVTASVVAAIVQVVVSVLGFLAARFGVRTIFVRAAQAIVAACGVALAHVIGVLSWFEAVACVGVPWMLLIPLPVLVSMVVDAVNDLYIAAVARAFVVVIATGGVALGAYAVVDVGSRLELTAPGDLSLPTLPLTLALLFSVIGAVANALANGGEADLLIPAAVLGLVTAVVNQSLVRGAGIGSTAATVCASIVLGVVSALWAKHSPYPSAVLSLMGITGALIPGLTVYLGIVRTVFGQSGTGAYVTALVTGAGIAVGVALGGLVVNARRPVAVDTTQEGSGPGPTVTGTGTRRWWRRPSGRPGRPTDR